MKAHTFLLPTIAAGALALAGSAFAQASTGGKDNTTVTMNTAQGQVVINSTPAPAPTFAAPPSFEQLSGGGKWISEEQAAAYPPLANDFLNASRHGKRISKAQYEHWVKQLK